MFPNIFTSPPFQRIYCQSLYCDFVLHSDLQSLQQTQYPVKSQPHFYQCTTYLRQHNGQCDVSSKQLCVSFVKLYFCASLCFFTFSATRADAAVSSSTVGMTQGCVPATCATLHCAAIWHAAAEP